MKTEPYTPTPADFAEARKAIGATPKTPTPIELLIAEFYGLAENFDRRSYRAASLLTHGKSLGKAAAYFDAASKLQALMPVERAETPVEQPQIPSEG